ncbi:B3 domain-containing transcription factor vrn1 [Thalictrum thalictroides]|uniref:B3 domain-containing transcription factor vrn1 n=1 Tax=Thalictrum thalictroides TaxID=46969 RepID=A0A7J6WHC3_THATH|nr:B3 domain-containing transcription factor vrn1 [Thalictrum thalictroides]
MKNNKMQHPTHHHHQHHCSPKRYKQQEPNRSSYSFFKIISPFIIQDGQLGIPEKFITKHGMYLPDVVVLKVPSGIAWQVELRKIDGSVYLQKGWLKFIDHYSICAGHVLVFRYNRKSQFDVLIFDMSCSEIEYLCNSKNTGQCNQVKDTLVGKIKDGDTTIGKSGSSSKRDYVRMRRAKTEERTGVILPRANAFKTKCPFFKVFMRPSYVHSRYVPLPNIFYFSHLKGLDSLTIQASNGKAKWRVRCLLSAEETAATKQPTPNKEKFSISAMLSSMDHRPDKPKTKSAHRSSSYTDDNDEDD